jgi:hypothetical protein
LGANLWDGARDQDRSDRLVDIHPDAGRNVDEIVDILLRGIDQLGGRISGRPASMKNGQQISKSRLN